MWSVSVSVSLGAGVGEAAAALLADVHRAARGVDDAQRRGGPPRDARRADSANEGFDDVGAGGDVGVVGDAEPEPVGDFVPQPGAAGAAEVVAGVDHRGENVDEPLDGDVTDRVGADDGDAGLVAPGVVDRDEDAGLSERDAVDPAVGVLVPADGVVDDEAGVDGGERVPDRSGEAAAEPSGKVRGCCSGGGAVGDEPGVPGSEQRGVVGEQVVHRVPGPDGSDRMRSRRSVVGAGRRARRWVWVRCR